MRAHSDLIVIREQRKPSADGQITIQLAMRTADIPHAEGGLVLEPTEIVEVTIPRTSYRPPSVRVTHRRFVGYPHVLGGLVLCIYLDASREWNPQNGAAGFLNRLWGWFESAAGGKFDPHTALFHAVGGTDHTTNSTPTVVIRDDLEDGVARAALVPRGDLRFDLSLSEHKGGIRVPIIASSSPLPLGAGTTLEELAMILDDPDLGRGGRPDVGLPSRKDSLGIVFAAASKRNTAGSPQPFVLRVPHPAGGAPHVLIGSLAAETADELRAGRDVPNARIDWWIAEFIARAGARRIVISDPAAITGGLLVRQNYTEDDIGTTKEAALASRLGAINDAVIIEVLDDSGTLDFAEFDLIIDASVSLALGQALSSAAPATTTAQVAVDPRTASVGMVLVRPAACPLPLIELDEHLGIKVRDDPSLEDYHPLWSPGTHDLLVPTRGCSVPTFHGSAADLAAAAGVMVSLLGQQLLSPSAGVHLFTLPHVTSPQTRASVFATLDPGAPQL
ncbi:thiamine biosynthesis protein ThiF [Microbacterium sp. ISL-108]|nr:thiamine biosynthesis protein ThiF [Microbacterium sp. ISL-108]